MSARILDAVWTSTVNHFVIECECGFVQVHPSNFWFSICSGCGRQNDITIEAAGMWSS